MTITGAGESTVLLAAANLLYPQLLQQLLDRSSSSDFAPISQVHSTVIGNRTFKPALGIFPRGCKWRDVVEKGSTAVQYEYWQEAEQQWVQQQPLSCKLQGEPIPGASDQQTKPSSWRFHKGNPRTEVVPSKHHVTYRNLWYNNGRWYALVEGPRQVSSWKFSKNQEITALHVLDAKAWSKSTKWRAVRGDTLLFDFIFFVHPTAIGHWWEMMGPLYSVLIQPGVDFKRPCDQMVLLHLKRTHLMEWVRAVVAVALGVGVQQELPPILLQQESNVPWQQLGMPLEGVPADEWVVFERAVIVRDLFTGGTRTFTNSADARAFRAEVYRQYGLPPPAARRRVPSVITFQRKRANRRIVNEDGLLELLSRYGSLRVVEFNSSTSFADQLATMRDTGVFVSAHTSNLANAVLLQPGSAVVEIIQRHWTWNRMDQSFRDHTAMLGDIHHFAWRASHANETVYQSQRDEIRFANWSKSECLTEDCTEAATRVDIVVDLAAFKALLDSRLPLVFAGKSVQQAALPWPEAL
ncbi:hypothetical protein OEZ86_010636 [Tetradesmus obliquus]|nr:hypothetical protein OEZ86_010636 [Tetradesmus obliquus]